MMGMRALMTGLILTVAASSVASAYESSSGTPSRLFFDWGKVEVRSDDRAVLDDVAARWKAKPSQRLHIIGHSDRSGSSAANRAVALRRAMLVRTELARRGVTGNAMRLSSFGEERQLIPTEDMVREVQNRRVEIFIEE